MNNPKQFILCQQRIMQTHERRHTYIQSVNDSYSGWCYLHLDMLFMCFWQAYSLLHGVYLMTSVNHYLYCNGHTVNNLHRVILRYDSKHIDTCTLSAKNFDLTHAMLHVDEKSSRKYCRYRAKLLVLFTLEHAVHVLLA